MFLLGVVIEKVTGEDYFDHIRKAIYAPAGMTNSDCYEMDYPVENLAIGYSPDWKSPYKWQNNLYKHVIKGGPAGGGFSTVKDLHRFALALLSGKLVSPERMRDLMWTDFKGASYGYGFDGRPGPRRKGRRPQRRLRRHQFAARHLRRLRLYRRRDVATSTTGPARWPNKIGRTLARVKAH